MRGLRLSSAAALLAAGCCVFSAPSYRGPVSDHFDGEKFRTRPDNTKPGIADFLRWQLTRKPGPWRDWTDAPPGPPPPRRVGRGQLRVTFVNHATVLIQMDGVNILTDPIWSERTSPVRGIGPRRRRPPGLRFEDLPPIDVVVISHSHYDHMDIPTLRRLAQRHRPLILAGLGNAALLAEEGIDRGHDLDWWQSVKHAGLRIVSVPTKHFSNRGLCDRDETLWTGFVFQGPAGSVLFAGDTAYGPHFAEIRRRLGRMRLAVLPIGAYRPRWFMSPVHMSPDEAVLAHRMLLAGTSMGMHYGTFPLADDGEHEAVEELGRALARHGVSPERFWALGFGEGRDVPPLPPLPPPPSSSLRGPCCGRRPTAR